MRLPAVLEALRHPDFAFYAGARFAATLAWQLLTVAAGWQLYALTKDPLALGLAGLAQFLPFVTLVLPAGQIADLADRRLVLVGAYACEVVSAGVLLWLVWSGLDPEWLDHTFTCNVCLGLFFRMWLHGFAPACGFNPTSLDV